MAVTKNRASGPALSAAIKAGKARAKRERSAAANNALAVHTARKVRKYLASESDLMTRLSGVLAAVDGLDARDTRKLLTAVLELLP